MKIHLEKKTLLIAGAGGLLLFLFFMKKPQQADAADTGDGLPTPTFNQGGTLYVPSQYTNYTYNYHWENEPDAAAPITPSPTPAPTTPPKTPTPSTTPTKTPTTTPKPTTHTYTVKKGDTLWSLSGGTNAKLQSVLKLNPSIKDPNKILVGQKIVLPN